MRNRANFAETLPLLEDTPDVKRDFGAQEGEHVAQGVKELDRGVG